MMNSACCGVVKAEQPRGKPRHRSCGYALNSMPTLSFPYLLPEMDWRIGLLLLACACLEVGASADRTFNILNKSDQTLWIGKLCVADLTLRPYRN